MWHARHVWPVWSSDDTSHDFTKNKHKLQEHSLLNSNKITRVPSRDRSRGAGIKVLLQENKDHHHGDLRQ